MQQKIHLIVNLISIAWHEQVVSHFDRWVFLLVVSFSWWLMSFTFGYQDHQFVMASKIWSDFGAHLPLVRSFSMGNNFPPEYPQFPGESIRYHYLFYALVGWLELLGMRIDLAMNLVSSFGLSLMIWMVYTYAKNLAGSVRAGLLAITLVLFNGSLSWWYFTQKYLQSLDHTTLWQTMSGWVKALVAQPHFATFGPWDGGVISAFWTLNVYTNQRHLPLSYGLVLLLLWPLVQTLILKKAYEITRWKAVAIVGLMSVFPLLHQAGVVILIGSIAALTITHTSKEVVKKHWRLFFVYALGVLMVGLAMATLVPSSHPLTWKFWFLAKEPSWQGIAMYWWQNLGLYLPLTFLLVWWPLRTRILTVIALGLLVVTNLLQLSPDMINNHKLVSFALLFLAISIAHWLITCWRSLTNVSRQTIGSKALSVVGKVGLVVVFFGLTLGGVVDYFPIVNDHKIVYSDWQKQPVAEWIKNNTPPESVFLTTEFFYHPANSVGRRIYVDYGYFAWSLGYKDQSRRQIMHTLFGPFNSPSDWCAVALTHQIDYVAINPKSEVIDDKVVISDSFVMRSLQPLMITDDGYYIFDVKAICQAR